MSRDRATLLVYNTVERLLRGDFFHFATMDEVSADARSFPSSWPVLGLGTSNWYKRNGEVIVEAGPERPVFLWADPSSSPPGKMLDLSSQRPESAGPLINPMVGGDDASPQFPFIALAVCDPAKRQEVWAPAGVAFHEWFDARMVAENIGLAAVSVEAELELIEYSAICHIPKGGLDVTAGYAKGDAWRFGRAEGRPWRLCGIYAANPTVQKMVSAEGRPLHFHGHATSDGLGGHVNLARTRAETPVTIHPLRDLILKISDLEVAWLPVKPLPE